MTPTKAMTTMTEEELREHLAAQEQHAREQKARNLAKLPAFCFIPNPDTEVLLARLVAGEQGYIPVDSLEDPDKLNAALGVSPRQVAAMRFGSMFGWHLGMADPDAYLEDGRPIPPVRPRRPRRFN